MALLAAAGERRWAHVEKPVETRERRNDEDVEARASLEWDDVEETEDGLGKEENVGRTAGKPH